MSARRFFAVQELHALHEADGVMDPAAYALRAPMPQLFLVTRDTTGEGVCVRTTTLCPLTWSPYAQSVNIPLDDTRVVRNLGAPSAECVLAEPTRSQLREIAICGQRAPEGVCEADIARLRRCPSQFVSVPSIADCPVNLECEVDHVEQFHTHLIAFTRVVGASIEDRYLFQSREEIIAQFPTNYVDDMRDKNGHVRQRVSMLKDTYLCPTFPSAPKSGWGHSFLKWMGDLQDEGYLSPAEYKVVQGWSTRLEELFTELNSPERTEVKQHLTKVCRLMVQGRWVATKRYISEQN